MAKELAILIFVMAILIAYPLRIASIRALERHGLMPQLNDPRLLNLSDGLAFRLFSFHSSKLSLRERRLLTAYTFVGISIPVLGIVLFMALAFG